MQRTNYCGLITAEYEGQHVILKGWVHRRRDLGGLIFLDIRDREGLVQVVVNPEDTCFNEASELKNDYVIEIEGIVRIRPNPNYELKTGLIEIVAKKISLLNIALPTPIIIDDANISEINRLSHRIIDLRSKKMQYNLKLRHKLTLEVRNYLDKLGFIDIETPVLTRSTPEGARAFLVPSRIYKGSFYALSQSPQLFKQLLMVSGFDRYYQIVKCFRDEDLRADRQPEFTQIDIETSFLSATEIRDIAEDMIVGLFKSILDIELPKLPVITYTEAMYLYGSDKPDLRIPLKFIDLTADFKHSEFKVFNTAANMENGRIVALKLPKEVTLSRKELDEYAQFVTIYAAKGLAYIKINDKTKLNEEGLQSPIIKFLSKAELELILEKTQAENGEIILFGADKAKIVNEAMGALRIKIGHAKKLLVSHWAPLWVIDFPMFEYDEEQNRYMACHHPFTAPKDEDLNYLTTNPKQCIAKAYDMVINGWEVGGGSIRIHQANIQSIVFDALDISKTEAQNKFGFLLDNLQFGAPPHGGIAFGLDRLATIMCKVESIRDVIAFPKTTQGQCLLTNAPNLVNENQLKEVGIGLL